MSSAETSPNVILLSVDALRRDFVGACSDEIRNLGLTPSLDEMARKGVSFRQAISLGPNTPSSVGPTLTSRYASRLQKSMLGKVSTIGMYQITGGTTLAQVFQDAGYATAAFHSNPVLSGVLGYDRGFEVFRDNFPHLHRDSLSWAAKLWWNRLIRLLKVDYYLPAPEINRQAIEWLGGVRRCPFFLWLHYMDTHGPFIGHAGFRYLSKVRGELLWRKSRHSPDMISSSEHKRIVNLYQEEVQFLDSAIGGLVTALEAMGLIENTIVSLTADHGEEFGEHGQYAHEGKLYDDLLRVPLILQYPHAPQGKTIGEQVSLLHLAPTLLDLAGLQNPESFLGDSLLPVIDGRGEIPQYAISESIYWFEVEANRVSFRTERWKYLYNRTDGSEELYDLSGDPAEQADVKNEFPEVASRLRGLAQTHLEGGAVADMLETVPDAFDNEIVKARLRALGYID